jgi:hypothetical protein
LLEVSEPQLVTQRLTLIVQADDFEAECDIRHRGAYGIGVFFVSVRIGKGGRDTRFAGPRLTTVADPKMIGTHLVS